MIRRILFPFIAFLIVASVPALSADDNGLTLKLDTNSIEVSEFFSGTRIVASGDFPSGSGLIVQLSGKAVSTSYRLKGKKGPFWLGAGNVKFHGVPWMVLVRSTGPLPEMLPESELKRLGLGRPGTAYGIKVTGRSDDGLMKAELLRLKERRGLYDFNGGGIEIERDGRYSCSFRIPPDIPPGDYRVSVYSVINGKISGITSQVLSVHQKRLVSFLKKQSKSHPAFYGIIAVLMAVGAGLITGLFAGRKKQRGLSES